MKHLAMSGLILMLVTMGWSHESFGEQPSAPRGELRIVDKNPANWVWIAHNVFDHLVEIDKDGQLVPSLAAGWHWVDNRTLVMSLRQGVRFHNGEVFDAAIVRLNWDAYLQRKQPHLVGTFMNFQPASRLEIIDSYTIRFRFPEPDGAALAKFTTMHIANHQFYRDVGWGEKHW